MMVTRKAFGETGGFESVRYPNFCNDVELCLRMKKKGYRCIYNPMIRAIHHKTKSRITTTDDSFYKSNLKKEYPDVFRNDPFYNPNLSLSNEQFIGYRDFPVCEQIPELLE